MGRCPECGAPVGAPQCAELYHYLLALDYSREEPWGPHHGITTACYLLQHPSWLRAHNREHPWILIHAFLDGGLPRLQRFTDRARTSNSHRRGDEAVALPRPDTTPPVPDRAAPTRFAVTIADLAVDGTFPAAGFPERTRDWAAATRDAWLSSSSGP